MMQTVVSTTVFCSTVRVSMNIRCSPSSSCISGCIADFGKQQQAEADNASVATEYLAGAADDVAHHAHTVPAAAAGIPTITTLASPAYQRRGSMSAVHSTESKRFRMNRQGF